MGLHVVLSLQCESFAIILRWMRRFSWKQEREQALMTREKKAPRTGLEPFADLADSLALEQCLGTEFYFGVRIEDHQFIHRSGTAVRCGRINLDRCDGFLGEFKTGFSTLNTPLLLEMMLLEITTPPGSDEG